jgi:hypothetical protein
MSKKRTIDDLKKEKKRLSDLIKKKEREEEEKVKRKAAEKIFIMLADFLVTENKNIYSHSHIFNEIIDGESEEFREIVERIVARKYATLKKKKAQMEREEIREPEQMEQIEEVVWEDADDEDDEMY